MAGTTIRELITRLGFDIDDEALDRFERRVSRVKTGLIAMTAVGVGAVAGLVAITKSAANTGDDLDAQASLFGVAVDQLQIWTRAAALGDIQAEEFTSSLQFLNRNLGDAARDAKGPAAKVFSQLGIGLKNSAGEAKKSGEVLDELVGKFAKISDPAKRASIAMDIFGRGGQRMGRFLAESGDNIARATEVVKAFGFFTAETAAMGDSANDAWDDTLTLFKGIKNEIGIGLLPVMKNLLTRLNAFLIANKDLIKLKIENFVKGATRAAYGFLDVLKAMAQPVLFIIKALGGIENAAKVAAVALAGLAGGSVIAAVSAFISLMGAIGVSIGAVLFEVFGIPILIAVGIASLVLIFEDLWGWINGSDSLLGTWLGSWKDFVAGATEEFSFMIEMIKALWLGLKTTFTGLFEFLSGAWEATLALWNGDTGKFVEGIKKEFTGLFHIVVGVLETIGSTVSIILDGLYEAFKGTFKVIGELIKDAIPPSLIKLIGFVGDKLSQGGGLTGGFAAQGTGFAFPGGASPGAYPGQVRPPAGAGGSTVNHYEINAPVTVPPGTSEQQAAFLESTMQRVVEESLGRHIGHVMQNNPRRE